MCVTAEDRRDTFTRTGKRSAGRVSVWQPAMWNFYIANDSIVVPQFGDAHDDQAAVEILEGLFPERKVEPVYARDILLGGGNIRTVSHSRFRIRTAADEKEGGEVS